MFLQVNPLLIVNEYFRKCIEQKLSLKKWDLNGKMTYFILRIQSYFFSLELHKYNLFYIK